MNLVTQSEIFSEASLYHSATATIRRREESTAAHDANKKKGPPVNDLTGKRFGMLTVETMTSERHHAGVVFLCRCDCGNLVKMTSRHLTRKAGPTTHCGCMGIGRGNKPRPGMGGVTNTIRVTKNNPLIAFRALQGNYRVSASSRGYKWELTEQQFLDLATGNCHYCGVEPYQVFVREPHLFTYNGVDRIDSSLGYHPDNCVSCCGQCNVAKKERTLADFLAWIDRVYMYQHG